MKNEYVLRKRDKDEISRLEFQHQVWSEITNFSIDKAEIKADDQVIDLGSGPGYLSYDLIQHLNDNGKITCFDNSDIFVNFINQKKYKNIEAFNLDIRNGLSEKFEAESVDKIFCRWVLMFSGKLPEIIDSIYETLAPDGKFISIEYFNFDRIDMFPKSPIFNKIYQNVEKILTSIGGNPNTGNELYKILEARGFRKVTTYPFFRTGKVNSPVWQWLERTNANHTNLVDAGLISQADLDLYFKEWEARSKNEHAFITAPPLMVTVGEKE